MARMYNDIFAKFQDDFVNAYNSSRSKLSSEWISSWKQSITTRFTGVIPQWVRENIQQSTLDFSVLNKRVKKLGWLRNREVKEISTNIFILAEVGKWEVNKEVFQRSDPLVVGYKGGCLWLICSFDETPLEKYVRMEFAS